MNESIFFLHLALVLAFLWPAMRFGREGLIAWVCLQPILANLFVLKQVAFFGYVVTCSDVYAVSCALGLNLIQEYYGKDLAKKTVWISFSLMLFFTLMSLIHLFYQPSIEDSTHAAYSTILSATPRLIFASVVSFLVVQFFDVQLFSFLKRKAAKAHLIYRNIISLTCSQFVDTFLFTFLGLYGLVDHLFDVFIVSFLIKLTIALVLCLYSLKEQKHEPISI